MDSTLLMPSNADTFIDVLVFVNVAPESGLWTFRVGPKSSTANLNRLVTELPTVSATVTLTVLLASVPLHPLKLNGQMAEELEVTKFVTELETVSPAALQLDVQLISSITAAAPPPTELKFIPV